MKKLTSVLFTVLISGGLMAAMAPVAQAQTYVYPITSGYVAPSYVAPYTAPYGSTYGNAYGTGCIALTNYLALGSTDAQTGGQVSLLQQFLNTTGYLNGVTGYFDQGTYGAVINYQVSHGIAPLGTVGPLTRSAINQQSCNGYGAPSVVVPPPIVPPVNCYSQSYPYQQCGCSNIYNGGVNYNNSYPYNGYNNCGVVLNSVSAAYNYGTMTLTIRGSGFTASGNTVHFAGSTYSGISSNGSTLIATIPSGYYSGNYNVYVVNGSGISSNTLSFPISSNTNQNNNGSVSLSSISGPTSVQAGTTNTWNVGISNSNSYYGYNYNNQYTNVTVTWGDNTSSNSQSIYLSGSQNLSFSHIYSNSGTYTINISANQNGQYSYQTLTVNVYGNNNGGYYYGSPNISYLSPMSGHVGTGIVIQGSGFSSFGNTVHFGNGGTMNVSSNNGSTIYYTIPSQVSGCDLTGSNGYCAQWLTYVSSGSYPIYVTNSSGQSSNTLYFTVN